MVLPAQVLPWAAYLFDRDCSAQMRDLARVLKAKEETRALGEDLLISVELLAEKAAEQWAAHTGRGFDGESAKVPGASSGARSVVPPRNPPHGLTVGEVAKRLSVSPQWVCQLCRDEVLLATKPGGRWLVDADSAESYEMARNLRTQRETT